MLERIVDGEIHVSVAGVLGRRAADMDITAGRQREVDLDFIEAAGLVAPTGRLEGDPTRGDPAEPRLELFHMFLDRAAQFFERLGSRKVDVNRCFHGGLRLDVSAGAAGRPGNAMRPEF